ncbi:methyl-accepting chemotaxis protein [Rhizobium chutanense]|uniref:methyl-accepting chemotaxis protein n=1 Tax=Rhizobium chutanense TaxID=2035448 RepID=UPI000F88C472|nr:PAS domain-containing methyl-accepting chemotaxis protein [Rhizobium chutanense]
MFNKGKTGALAESASNTSQKADLFGRFAGVGLWDVYLPSATAGGQERHTFSAEFRRLLGFRSEADFPNVVSSWATRIHPDDLEFVTSSFGAHLADASGKTSFDVTYRLATASGEYRWFRSTGGTDRRSDGSAWAAGSLIDIHAQKTLELQVQQDAELDRNFLEALSRAMAALADGDLLNRMPDTDQKFEKSAQDFNKAVSSLASALGNVLESAEKITDKARSITVAANRLSSRSEIQAVRVEESAAALGQINQAIGASLRNTETAIAGMAKAQEEAQSASAIVRDATASVQEIATSSNEISGITSMIDEIAFQTNLLALNAGVEAARAGESGRGFAVVATEVRALAQRSAVAAKKIRELLDQASKEVDIGVQKVANAESSLQKISTRIAELVQLIGLIATSTREQASAVRQLSDAVASIDEDTQLNATMASDTNNACAQLDGIVEQLTKGLQLFQVRSRAMDRLRLVSK